MCRWAREAEASKAWLVGLAVGRWGSTGAKGEASVAWVAFCKLFEDMPNDLSLYRRKQDFFTLWSSL